MDIREHVPLHEYTTFKLGGKSRYFIRVETGDKLHEAVAFAKKHDAPIFVLGEGSNVLIRDEGFPGVTIQLALQGTEVVEEDEYVDVSVAAGEHWDSFVEWAVRNNLYGIENLSGIPGTVGAAPIQNIGAYGMEAKDVITSVQVFDTTSMSSHSLPSEECAFTYRDSIFKKLEGKHFIVVGITLRLQKNAPLRDDYKDIKQYFEGTGAPTPTLKAMREAVLHIRARKFPDLSLVGTAGSFFKNPVVTQKEFSALREHYPSISSYQLENGDVKLPLAWILEHACNVKGITVGSVGTFKEQPLVLVHFGGGTTKELQRFATMIQQKVKEKTNIEIIPEVTFI